MNKILGIGWKEVKLAFRDRAGLILMLLAPMLLTLGLGLVTGSFNRSSSPVSGIPVVLVNLDRAQIGNAIVDTFASAELKDLMDPMLVSDAASARKMVDDDKAAAALIIPVGFTDSIIPNTSTGATGPLEQIELYANPTRTTSASVVKTILEGFLGQVEVGRISAETSVAALIDQGLIQPGDAAQLGAQIGMQQGVGLTANPAIALEQSTTSGSAAGFNALAYMAPGMALMFLMYTVSYGGRSILYEKQHGTLPRLMVAPLTTSQILGGKILGVYLTGVIQMLILIGASAVLFDLNWGNPLSILLVVLSAVFAAVGWGSLIVAFAKTPSQVANIGSAMMLTFGILGGSFFSVESMPGWYTILSRITPNAWGISSFSTLAAGGTLLDILPAVFALLAMGGVLFIISVVVIRRRGLFQE